MLGGVLRREFRASTIPHLSCFIKHLKIPLKNLPRAYAQKMKFWLDDI